MKIAIIVLGICIAILATYCCIDITIHEKELVMFHSLCNVDQSAEGAILALDSAFERHINDDSLRTIYRPKEKK